MFGKIFLILYVIIQTGISILTEYVIQKNRFYKNIGKKTRIIRIILYVILDVFPVLGAFLPKSGFKYLCMKIGNLWLAFFMYYSALAIFLTLIFIIVSKIKKQEDYKLLGQVLNIAVIISTVISMLGLLHAQNPKIVNYDITLDKKSAEVSELKVVLIADLHLSVNSNVRLTEKMVEEVNSVNPDLIVIAGDIFTSNIDGLRNPEAYSAALSKMHAKYGVYAVCGNHDVDENLFSGFSISPVSEAFRTPEMDKFFADSGFNMLYDECIEIADGNVVLAGRIDAEKAGDGTKNRMSSDELLKDVDKNKPVLVLQHEPIEFKALSEAGADMVLSGHTHNGQVFPGNLFVPFFNENAYGVKKLYDMYTVVTAGVGYYGPPIRVGTDSEVTVINIKFE